MTAVFFLHPELTMSPTCSNVSDSVNSDELRFIQAQRRQVHMFKGPLWPEPKADPKPYPSLLYPPYRVCADGYEEFSYEFSKFFANFEKPKFPLMRRRVESVKISPE